MLTWDPNAVEEGVTGYRVYQSQDGEGYQMISEVTGTQSTIDVEIGQYEWYVTAFNESQESGPSNSIRGRRLE